MLFIGMYYEGHLKLFTGAKERYSVIKELFLTEFLRAY